MNKLPITARKFNEDEFVPISPSDLLLGRAAEIEERLWTGLEGADESQLNIANKQQEIQKVVDAWWKQWIRDAFALFCLRKKWTVQHRSMKVGDIVLLRYVQQLGKDKFRVAIINAVHPDNHGFVRTVTVGLRDNRKSRREKWYEAKTPQTQMTVGIQRLGVLLPVDQT